MKEYWLKLDGFWMEKCRDYGDMVQKAFGYRLLGNKVVEIIK